MCGRVCLVGQAPAPAAKTEQASSASDRRFVTPDPPLQIPVRTIQIRRPTPPATPPPEEVVPLPPERPIPAEKTKPIAAEKTKPRSRGDDICARHNMRKVMTNKYSWRCRR